MSIENFKKVTFSDQKKFDNIDGKICLRSYSDDLMLYSSFDSTLNAMYAKCNIYPGVEGSATPEDSGVFAQYARLSSASITYNKSNFDEFKDQGSIKFRLSPKFNNAFGEQSFKATSLLEVNSIPSISKSRYKFGGGSLNLTGNATKYVQYAPENILELVQKGSISFFVAFNYNGIPNVEKTFFDIRNSSDNANRIILTHNTDGKIYFKIYDQTALEKVNVNFDYLPTDKNFHNIEVDFDLNEGNTRVFFDGVQYGSIDSATATRVVDDCSLFVGGVSDFYIDDFAIFTQPQNEDNFTPREYALSGGEENLIVYADYNSTISLDKGVTKAEVAYYPDNSEYAFDLYVDDAFYKTIVINVTDKDTFSSLAGKINAQLNVVPREAEAQALDDELKIVSTNKGAEINIEENTDYGNFVNLMGGVYPAYMPNAPLTDTVIFSSDNPEHKNEIQLIHTTYSELILKMYDSNGVLRVDDNLGIFSNEYNEWFAIELDFNASIYQLFIDGKLFGFGKTGFSRGAGNSFTISSGESVYGFDELIIYNEPQHFSDYDVEEYALTPYSTEDPYIDVEFGKGFSENQIKGINILGTSGLSFIIKVGETPYYYFNGAWRVSDNTYSQSTSLAVTEANFSSLYFDTESDLTFRVFFDSDGFVEQWLDKIELLIDTTGLYPATLIGTKDLTEPVDLSEDYLITITTDQGSATVDLRTAAEDPEHVTMDEIKQAIDEAQIPGLAEAMDDGHGHLMLQTTTLGDDAYLAVTSPDSNNAVPIVWGEDSETSGDIDDKVFMDYSGLRNIILARLGSPTVPVELTDEQVDICIDQAIYWYNYYRNSRENRVMVELKGNDKDGYEIPECVGGQDNILDVIFKPMFPFSYYLTVGNGDNFFSNMFMQTFFLNQSGFNDFLSDFYCLSSALKDYANILGKNQVYYIYNNKIYINPKVRGQARVGIIYRSALSADELLNNIHVQDLATYKAMSILGQVRSTFGGQVQVGDTTLNMPAQELIQRGDTLFAEKINKLQSLEEPLFLSWF